MCINLVILCLLVKWGFLCALADGNCTQGCTLKQHLQCQMFVSVECPMPIYSSLPPGKPTDLHVTRTYGYDPAIRTHVCVAALNITWRVPSDASRLYVKAFQLQILSLDQLGWKECILYKLTQANWTEDDEQIQYFYQCLTLPPGDYDIELASLPYPFSRDDTNSFTHTKFTVEKVYPGHDGSCVLPPPRTPSTTLEPRVTLWPQKPQVPPHKLNVTLVLVVIGGCLLFAALSTLVFLWRRLRSPDIHDDQAPIWNNGMPQSAQNNACNNEPYRGFPIIPPYLDATSVSSDYLRQEAGDVNRVYPYTVSRLPPSENACDVFGGSTCYDHSSELCCDGCGAQFEGGVNHDVACPGVFYEGALDHCSACSAVGFKDGVRQVPRVGYGGDVSPRVVYGGGARPNPGVEYDDEVGSGEGYFDGAGSGPNVRYDGEEFDKLGPVLHGRNNLEIDHQSVGRGHV